MKQPNPVRHRPPAVTVMLLLLAWLGTQGSFRAPAWAADTPPASPSLVRIEVDRPLDTLGVPIVAHLQDAAGREYALALVPTAQVEAAGLSYTIVDRDAAGAAYLIAFERRPGIRQQAARRHPVLLDDGRRMVVRADAGRAEELTAEGFDVILLRDRPLVLRAPATMPALRSNSYHPDVAAMIDEVDEGTLFDYLGNLTGENPVNIGGSPYTITTRATASGRPIEMATQYVSEHMEARGLAVSYHAWSRRSSSGQSYSGRNIIGRITGQSRPGEIVLVTAHLDSAPFEGPAPGADDDASGSVALMIAAEIMSQRHFERTTRFVFFTGEEQYLLGSAEYATAASQAGENIVAVFNLDMIAWDEVGGPLLRLHTRLPSDPGYSGDMAIANAFVDVVNTYGLDSSLTPIVDSDGSVLGDHSVFWAEGYSAIKAIEDAEGDFNAYYHTPEERRQYLNMPYYTSFVKAAVGTAVQLAIYSDDDLVRPNRLEAAILSPTMALTRWNDRSDNEGSFEIQFQTDSGSWKPAATVGTNVERAIISGLTPETTCKFRVRARTSVAVSDWSNQPAVTMPAALAKPDPLKVTALSPTRVRLEWNDKSRNERSFQVQFRSGTGPWEDAPQVEANVTQVVISALTPETTYTFRVRARNRTGLSEWSKKKTVTMPAELISPNQLEATVLSSTRALLEWNDRSDNEESFEVQVRTGSGPWEDAARVEADVERLVLSDLTPAITYSFRIRAYSPAGFSSWSNKQTVTMPAGE
ncbi:MAG: M28 family peptidase [bacterium]|nr:M28 family peptidase [bacterium]